MTVNGERFFNELLPAAMLENPQHFNGIGYQYTFRITGQGGGEWCVNASNSGPFVRQGDLGNSDCSMTMSAEDFQQCCQNPNNFVALNFSGRMEGTGNPMAAREVYRIFNLGNSWSLD
ncbi:SCP2 sterol-binding domain-containing protein [Microcoleus sp. MOSTC5]|uniref:SCP2 sterol-binding domain-containing protein n=1 Tax=Microcoleus sp. MOSTC5 TaxID=3055378 RepID=UPI002FD58994